MSEYVELFNDITNELDGMTIKDAIKTLSLYPEKAKIKGRWYYDEYVISIFLEETKEEKQARLAAEKAAKEAEKLEKRRQQYLKLKAEFEGECNEN